MRMPDARSVWDSLEDRFGESPRAVVRYDGFDYDTITRPDVRERYSDEEAIRLVNDVVVNQLILSDSEELFEAGRYRAFVRVFDDAWIITKPDDAAAKTGYVVSPDRSQDGSSVEIGDCVDYFEELVSADTARSTTVRSDG
jgi:hypothetical protein